ncbi:MAG: hypothetical protein CML29_17270 [Rhizobiales bacterium]|nr:hypothetical protein [Hyphomicrobiales bacterium]|tara:strand:+ start:308 stop:562 length:255 start_codon:yes stop_codon:yes gene_type:complete
MKTLRLLNALEDAGDKLLAKSAARLEDEFKHDIANLVASIKAARRLHENDLRQNHNSAGNAGMDVHPGARALSADYTGKSDASA